MSLEKGVLFIYVYIVGLIFKCNEGLEQSEDFEFYGIKCEI
jgi:hypothetical protein